MERNKFGPTQIARHIVQLLAFLFANGKIFGLGSTVLIVPYLHSTQSPFSTVFAAYDSLEFSFARGLFPLLVIGIILLTATSVGRLFCGWACPVGMIQDFLSYLPMKKQKLHQSTLSSIKDLKWVVLGFTLLTTIVVGIRSVGEIEETGSVADSPFSILSPSSTLFSFIPWMFLWKENVMSTVGIMGWLKMAFLVLTLAPSLYVPRFFCRFVCPLGALLEPFSKYKLLRIVRTGKATKEQINGLLGEVCPMGVTVQDESPIIDHPNCINCGKCMKSGYIGQKFLD